MTTQPASNQINHEPKLRVMALHSLVYCERLFYLEEVEEIRVADVRVYEGRRMHELLPEYSELQSFVFDSESLGLYGKIDCLRSKQGEWLPYEYKKGRARQDGSEFKAWPSDEVQVAAYTMLLEEHLQTRLEQAKVYYAKDHRTVTVTVDESLRHRVMKTIERARLLRQTPFRPPICENERLCANCSLAPVCLPEEERLVESPGRETLRLFPEEREGEDLHVTQPGSTVRRSGNKLVVENRDGEKQSVPVEQIESVTLHGPVQITTQTLQMCVERGIHIHWISSGGKYIGSVVQAAGGVQRRLRQYKGLTDEELKLRLSRSLVGAKVESQLRYVLRLTRNSGERGELMSYIVAMKQSLKNLGKAQNLDQLLGYEGNAARAYFACFAHFTKGDHYGGIVFEGRNRRPPTDPANALLSFLYGMLYRDCVQAIVTVGLDPTIGIYHQPRSTAYPLALDIMELFRVAVVDVAVLGSIHRRQWSLEEDFIQASQHVWLNDVGRKKAIALYERRMQDKWKHPVIGYSLSYARALELEVRLLEKEWSGKPGLFAMNRLR
jgi:CRISPR-associated protein Cas1